MPNADAVVAIMVCPELLHATEDHDLDPLITFAHVEPKFDETYKLPKTGAPTMYWPVPLTATPFQPIAGDVFPIHETPAFPEIHIFPFDTFVDAAINNPLLFMDIFVQL
jgi:hypothetical protein